MEILTLDQQKFIEDQGIPISLIFDASGMKRSEYSDAMRNEDKFFTYGVTPCNKAGHSLRTRSGTCIQCSPASISYTLRYYRTANIYIAGSLNKKLIKVGTSIDLPKLMGILNCNTYGCYAGTSDWRLLSYISANNAGKVEFSIHQALQLFHVQVEFLKNGKIQVSRECFACGYITGKLTLLSNFDPSVWEKLEEQKYVDQYEFNSEAD